MASSSFTDAVVLFGDSITQYIGPGSFVQRMEEFYIRKLDVINRGFAGYTSKWALPVFEQIFATTADRERGRAQDVKLMIMWFGANDCALPGQAQHVPLEEYKANLSKMVSYIHSPDSPYASPGTKVILITPGPIIEADWAAFLKRVILALGMSMEEATKPTRDLKVVGQYAKACLEVAQAEGVAAVDMFSAMYEAAGGTGDEEMRPFFTDGLHFSSAGYEVLMKKITACILENYPELDPVNLPMRLADFQLLMTGKVKPGMRGEADSWG